jgi:hypothetical protein
LHEENASVSEAELALQAAAGGDATGGATAQATNGWPDATSAGRRRAR